MDMSIIKTLESSDELIDIENHFKLIAGPGAGKTKFLTNHINNIIGNSARLGISKKVVSISVESSNRTGYSFQLIRCFVPTLPEFRFNRSGQVSNRV